MPAPLGSGRFDQLTGIAPADGEGFVRLRRRMIADLLDRPGIRRAELAALQSELDCRRAIAASPQQSVETVMLLLAERVADLKQLSERLAQQVEALR